LLNPNAKQRNNHIKGVKMSNLYKQIYEGIMEGNNAAVQDGVTAALEANLNPEEILNQGMISAMTEVGRLFEEGECFVPEMLIAARAMQSGLSILRPALVKADFKPKGKVAIGTVKGDLHDIGKNLVGMMLEGAGFEIVDLGVDVTPEQFLDAVQNNQVNVIALSALLTTTMSNMKATIDALVAAGVRNQVKVVVGGAPVTQVFANQIGADGFAQDASQAALLTETL
jgi:5-methyltetrahydrofolate--homocysteine methyltransferase